MKLTKADLDKVRHIEGFPIGRDEDIIALSRPPYYTACPNPFIEDFIRENGTPYDEATDDYHREPFAADVSEGKSDPIYMAHSYHTKVPHKAIMRYILHYTKPGDIVFDGFCGTGMTAVAAHMCSNPDYELQVQIEAELPYVEWGERKAIINDLSPAATFIAYNYTMPMPYEKYKSEAERILREVSDQFSWMYETKHRDDRGYDIIGIDGKPIMGHIDYTIWSDAFICPSCAKEFIFYDAATNANGTVSDSFSCPHCGAKLSKRDCDRSKVTVYDDLLDQSVVMTKQVPVLIVYSVGSKRFGKAPDEFDYELLERINRTAIPFKAPTDELPEGMNTDQPKKSHGVCHVHQFFTRRNLIALSAFWERICSVDDEVRPFLMQYFIGSLRILSKQAKHNKERRTENSGLGWVNAGLMGTLYISSCPAEQSVLFFMSKKTSKILPMNNRMGNTCISVGSCHTVPIPENSIDYIFTDPPFGANINYSELSFLWEAWLRVYTNNSPEAIINSIQKKGLAEYQALMEECFRKYYSVLKPGHWMTVEFHNSQNAVWNAIQESMQRVGFVVADVRTLDKKIGSFKQVTTTSAVKQDLVISAYKPKESFVREFQARAGEPEMAWEFVRQHLHNVPITADGNRDGKLDIIAERQDYLLFDRMVAWHIMNGIPVPMDAHTFYDGLRQRFLERDGMFFLPDQVTEYDDKRAHMELDVQQMSFLVTDEKNAIAWLNYILVQGPKTYQEIQPLYLQELHQSKQEKMPELLDMLRENFVQDENGAWYIPDLNNAADLAKVRRKALLKEFYDSCVPGKGKLKVFRMEAIRAGFDECWKQRDFATIVSVGERLPEAALQEDQTLLMYYDNACSRV